ncbi:MAG: hypothetical protein ACLGSA_16425 [Acidobacteriota bacterium]
MSKNSRHSTLAFCETKRQVEALAQWAGQDRRGLTVVAVTPKVNHLAREAGFRTRPLENFCSWESLCLLGDDNNARADRLCAACDALLDDVAAGHPHRDLVSFEAFFHPLKGLLDSLVFRLVPVQKALRALRPRLVVCFEAPPYEVSGPNLLDKPTLGLTTRLAPLAAGSLSLETVVLPQEPDPELAPEPMARPPLGSNSGREPRASLREDFAGLDRAVKSLPEPLRVAAAPVLYADPGLDGFLTGIIDAWKGLGPGRNASPYELLAWDERSSPLRPLAEQAALETGLAAWEALRASPEVRGLLRFEGLDLFELAAPQLRLITQDYLPQQFVQAAQADASLRGRSGAVLALGGMIFQNHALAKAAARHGVPVVSFHKGGYLGYSLLPMHERFEMAEADYYVCNGQGAARTFAAAPPQAHWRPGRKRGVPVPLGAAWLDRMVRERTGARPEPDPTDPRPTVVYVMSAFLGDNTYLGYVFQPEIWLQRLQLEMVEFFTGFPDIRFLFKPPLWDRYPQNFGSLTDFLARRKPENVAVLEPNAPLRQILDRHHAFIVDTPSTPFVELAASDRPFLAYLDRRFFRLVPQAARELRKRAPLARTRGEFFQAMETFFREKPWETPRPVDDGFITLFGTGEPTGHGPGAAARTGAFLRSLSGMEGTG